MDFQQALDYSKQFAVGKTPPYQSTITKGQPISKLTPDEFITEVTKYPQTTQDMADYMESSPEVVKGMVDDLKKYATINTLSDAEVNGLYKNFMNRMIDSADSWNQESRDLPAGSPEYQAIQRVEGVLAKAKQAKTRADKVIAIDSMISAQHARLGHVLSYSLGGDVDRADNFLDQALSWLRDQTTYEAKNIPAPKPDMKVTATSYGGVRQSTGLYKNPPTFVQDRFSEGGPQSDMVEGFLTKNGDVYIMDKSGFHATVMESAGKKDPAMKSAIPMQIFPDGSILVTDAIRHTGTTDAEAGKILAKYAPNLEQVIGMPLGEINQWNSAERGDLIANAYRKNIPSQAKNIPAPPVDQKMVDAYMKEYDMGFAPKKSEAKAEANRVKEMTDYLQAYADINSKSDTEVGKLFRQTKQLAANIVNDDDLMNRTDTAPVKKIFNRTMDAIQAADQSHKRADMVIAIDQFINQVHMDFPDSFLPRPFGITDPLEAGRTIVSPYLEKLAGNWENTLMAKNIAESHPEWDTAKSNVKMNSVASMMVGPKIESILNKAKQNIPKGK